MHMYCKGLFAMTALIERWRGVKQNIDIICQQEAIKQSVCLIAVSKTFSVLDIRSLYDAGQRDFGENYIQEFSQKADELADLAICWHMIGHIQSNKSQLVARKAQWVHTIDRPKIAQRLNEQRPNDLPPLNVCIEVNIAKESAKHGVMPDEQVLLPLARFISSLPKLKLRGLMCVAKANSTATELHQQFYHMHTLLLSLQQAGFEVDTLSMGMSDDLAIAIAEGATYVRVGRAIFGQR